MGYLIYENFLDASEIEMLRKQCHQIVEDMNPKEHMPTVFSTVKQVSHIPQINREDFKTKPPVDQRSRPVPDSFTMTSVRNWMEPPVNWRLGFEVAPKLNLHC